MGNGASAIPAVSPLTAGGLAAALQPPARQALLSALLPLPLAQCPGVKPFSSKMQHLYRQILPLLTCIQMVFCSSHSASPSLSFQEAAFHCAIRSNAYFSCSSGSAGGLQKKEHNLLVLHGKPLLLPNAVHTLKSLAEQPADAVLYCCGACDVPVSQQSQVATGCTRGTQREACGT